MLDSFFAKQGSLNFTYANCTRTVRSVPFSVRLYDSIMFLVYGFLYLNLFT